MYNILLPFIASNASTGAPQSACPVVPGAWPVPSGQTFAANATTVNGRWNLRAGAPRDTATAGQGDPIVTLPLGERVLSGVQAVTGWTWVATNPASATLGRFAGRSGWVATRGLKIDLPVVGPLLGVPVTSVAYGVNEYLAPAGDELLPATQPSATARRVAAVWNKYGNFVRALARKLAIDYRAALSVFVIEAGSRAYDENGRMIVRCEAHLLERWGGNRAVWAQYFTRDFNAQAWVGHRVRFDPSAEWISYHNNNTLEWQVIDLAGRLFGREVAARSTSMGLPQVLGDNFRALGYGNAVQMLDELQRSTHSQIAGHFDYLVRAKLIDEVQREDWTAFAASYNGGGQSTYYGNLIRSTVSVAQKLLPA